MGVWERISTAIDFVKQNTPDVTPVTGACRKGYDVGRAATNQVDSAVRAKARDFHEYFSDDQVRANVARIATNFSKNGALYLARYYGGGPVIDVVRQSLRDEKVDSQKGSIQELEARVAKLEKELNALKTVGQVRIPSSSMPSKAGNNPDFNTNLNERPEDLLQIFMVKEFIRRRLLDDLIVPGTGSRRKEKPVSSFDRQYE
ncbi:hypothetical protein Cgig2_027427 [Carnegiea gigantea]|uniref:Uncharacterized protein n=1 Tax=Carnegiea gigantea TaxID=171969 RepID=A0A9Q1H066_9CARY|nr:hypothetical protein Cgig2_027427 [Carnegiea gigantea]